MEISDETTVSELQAMLDARCVDSVEIHMYANKRLVRPRFFHARAHTSASRGPSGPFVTESVHGSSLSETISNLCTALDRAFIENIVVSDSTGRPRGVYSPTVEGRQWAREMARYIGETATIAEPAQRTPQ